MHPACRKFAIVIVIFVITGVARSGWESSLDRRLTEASLLREPPADVDWRQRLRQEVLSAMFGKLRSVMAIYWTLAGMEDWADKDWPGVEKNFRMATDLDPEDTDLWSFAIWQLETNAASYWIMRDDVSKTVRDAEAMQWVLKGLGFADRSLQYHPESAKLLAQTGKIYADKLMLPCKAAEYYKRARDGDSPLGFLTRFYPYYLALCSGSEKEAYQILMELYLEERERISGTETVTYFPHRVPTLIKRIKMLEEKLGVPPGRRIRERDPDREILEQFPHARGVLDKVDVNDVEETNRIYLTLKYLYDRGPEYRSPIMIEALQGLEEKLKIPKPDRISAPETGN